MTRPNRLGALTLLACIAVVATSCTSATSTEPTAAEPVATAAAVEPGPTHLAPKGELVRLAYNNEAWITLGYRTANNSLGQNWMLLEVGMTVMSAASNQAIGRDAVSLTTPGGETIPLASQESFTKGNLRSLDARANTVRDSINYFPAGHRGGCRIGFFTDVSKSMRGMAWDTVTLNHRSSCFGRLYFEIPDGIQYGQHFLNVQFREGLIQVPFKIMTKDDLKDAVREFDQMVKDSKAQAEGKK